MALRKQLVRNIPSDRQQTDENTQEDESDADSDDGDEFSSLLLSTSREKRRKERENKAKPKEMTEEEMMDLAMRLSEKEASDNAFQRQQEEEAMMKALQESMVGQTQPCLNSQSKALLADASLRLVSRRKLSYSTGEVRSAFDQGLPEDGSTSKTDLNSAKRPADENISGNKKRKRRAGSPLLEMPDLSQSQDSPHSLESSSAPQDSPQSSDSTQIDDSQLQKSPVFPPTGRRVALQIDRLNQDLLETCGSSGFVLCSQDRWTFSQKSVQPRSPTFPRTNPISRSKSSVFSETDQGGKNTEPSPDCVKSPDIGRNGTSLGSCRLPDCENSAFAFSSQESLTPSVASCCPKSPVFPQSPKNPLHSDGLSPKSPDRGETEQDRERSGSPVFGMTTSHTALQKNSMSPSASELRGSNGEEKLDSWKDKKSDGFSHDEVNTHSSKSDELNKKSKHWNSSETELTSDMTLVWSDEAEEDDTPVGSPSPVFPEERPALQADHQTASQSHDAAGSSGKNRPGWSLKTQQRESECSVSPATASTSTSRQQISTTEELPPISRQEVTRRTSPHPEESSDKQLVHYYWGVPFCPRGLDPDRYTQVILAQMEVYEKSLKKAQRFLLRKAEWGEAVEPQPEKSPSPEAPAPSPSPPPQLPRRRGLRLRGRKTSETAESLPAEEEEERKEEKEEQQEKEEEKKNNDDEEQMDTDDCDVCPETQLSNDGSTDDLMMVTDGEAEISSQKSPDLPEVEVILREDSPFRTDPCEDEELGVTPTKTKENISGNNNARPQSVGEEKEVMEDRRDQDVEEIKNAGLQRSASPELELAVVPHSPNTSVDCPICQASFPVSEIEMHAAYCDGEVAVVAERRPEEDRFQETVMLCRKRIKRTERKAEETIEPSNTGRNQETCFICQKTVPLRDYSRHTELCYRRSTSRIAAKGNLLSALEKTENRDSDAGPSGSKRQPEAVIDLRDDDDDDDDEDAALQISNSPIRSFTSISDATGCLIDFKKQQRSKKPSQKRR